MKEELTEPTRKAVTNVQVSEIPRDFGEETRPQSQAATPLKMSAIEPVATAKVSAEMPGAQLNKTELRELSKLRRRYGI